MHKCSGDVFIWGPGHPWGVLTGPWQVAEVQEMKIPEAVPLRGWVEAVPPLGSRAQAGALQESSLKAPQHRGTGRFDGGATGKPHLWCGS